LIEKLYEKYLEEFQDTELSIDTEEFKQEIFQLLQEINVSKKNIESFKEELSDLFNQRKIVESQIHITKHALQELKKDYNFAVDELPSHVECPTCHTSYENSFSERFSIARDEDTCLIVMEDLQSSLKKIQKKIDNIRERIKEQDEHARKINNLLSTKKDEITLTQLIDSKGSKNLLEKLEHEKTSLQSNLAEVGGQIKQANKELRETNSKERKKEIVMAYRNEMEISLDLLNVNTLSPQDYKDVHSKIKESGSDVPRALLAYYVSILKVMTWHYDNPVLFPFIIDSPQQQEQDDANMKAILSFIRERIPNDFQLILGTVKLHGVELEGKKIELSNKLSLLVKEDYESSRKEYTAFISKVQEYLQSEKTK